MSVIVISDVKDEAIRELINAVRRSLELKTKHTRESYLFQNNQANKTLAQLANEMDKSVCIAFVVSKNTFDTPLMELIFEAKDTKYKNKMMFIITDKKYSPHVNETIKHFIGNKRWRYLLDKSNADGLATDIFLHY